MPLPTIAIDGPAGAGKSTVARGVAERLGLTYIDSGAMYRAIAWKALHEGVATDDPAALSALAERTHIDLTGSGSGPQRVLVDGVDVTAAIRSPEVTRLSSPVSAVSGVRRALVARQQAMGREGGVVMEGRDIGTVVFPHADVKVFVTASERERARRRWEELRAKGEDVTLDEVLERQRERDARDSSRADSPLVPAPDAVMLDTDGLSVDDVVGRIVELCRRRGGPA